MARIITQEQTNDLDQAQTLWAYNALDCVKTSEVFQATHPQLDSWTGHIYQFELSSLAPALELCLRGIKVDLARREQLLQRLSAEQKTLLGILKLYGEALIGEAIKANSPKQLQKVLYNVLNLPIQHKYDRQAKENKISTDRTALEKLRDHSLSANALVSCILALRDNAKTVSVLQSGVDPDGRMRFSFNVGGTESGRWSSSKSAFGGGMNAQNVTEDLREIFIADKGYKLAYIDLEQAESRAVATLSRDDAYHRACNSGDLHTAVSRLIWPQKEWTGDLEIDRKVASQTFYRQFSYRDMAKRGGHASNYLGTPRTIGTALKLEQRVIEGFQLAYFKAFPGIRRWHQEVARKLQTEKKLTTPFGRRRQFLGRAWDDSTLREAIAYVPQSLIADYLNTGLLRLWSWGKVEILAQVHDAVLLQYPENQPELVVEAQRILSSTIRLTDNTTLAIPADVAIGWNWHKASEANPDGLQKVNPLHDPRKRQRDDSGSTAHPACFQPATLDLLDQRLS